MQQLELDFDVKRDLPVHGKFYNTIHEAGHELEESKRNVSRQEQLILSVLRKRGPLTPLQVADVLREEGICLLMTSVRRGLTNLVKQGFADKTEEKIVERYGKANYLWKVIRGNDETIF